VHLATRKLLMASLVTAFCGQTALVYLDDTAHARGALSTEARIGRRIWHQRNCQVCHQIYGFGGFLGPDLTNAAPRLTRERLDEVLTRGTGEMPAFHLQPDEITAVQTFLQELDRTGVGVARHDSPADPREVLAAVTAHMAGLPGDDPVRRGFQLFRQTCSGCHVPLQATALGPNTAPDLSTVMERLDEDAVRKTIAEGRIDRGMPAWRLGPGIEDIVAMLRWLGAERTSLAHRIGGVVRSKGLPWWEFR
jgi:nitric oxide reductase subunit C